MPSSKRQLCDAVLVTPPVVVQNRAEVSQVHDSTGVIESMHVVASK